MVIDENVFEGSGIGASLLKDLYFRRRNHDSCNGDLCDIIFSLLTGIWGIACLLRKGEDFNTQYDV